MEEMGLMTFYYGKRVFLTGHTGFKGSWLTKMLVDAGAEVTGYALQPPTQPNLFTMLGVEKAMRSVLGDIRDTNKLKQVFDAANPEIVFHLAAQPIVRESYRDPAYTYETNVLGTVNILECVRQSNSVRSFLNVTTDKVYENREWAWGYRETDPLDGYDPYSNSKSCSELVTHSYQKSFFQDGHVSVSTARAGNVIGGGDFANDRIIPDAVRAALKKETIVVRNPYSTRPYQHVLEPLRAYLTIAKEQYDNTALAGAYNVGPDDCDCITTGELATLFCQCWGEGMAWENRWESGPHEANFLKLDCSKLKTVFGWKPVWHVENAVDQTVAWAKAYRDGRNVSKIMVEQIQHFFREVSKSETEGRTQNAGKKDREAGTGRNIEIGG
jgi:CDP-glucose 4,6-dehydratase